MKIEILKTGGRHFFKKMAGPGLGFGAALILLVVMGVTVVQYTQPWDTRPRGERLFATHCAGCHGAAGQGGTGMALDSTGHMYQHTCSQLKLHIAIGSRGSGYMPSYWGKLSNEEMTDIVLFFQRWWMDEQIAEFQTRTNCFGYNVVPLIMEQMDLPPE